MNNDWRPVITNYAGYGLDRSSPYDFDLVDIRRGEDGEISTVDFRKTHPAMNVFGLYWRPTRARRFEKQVADLMTQALTTKIADDPTNGAAG